MATFVSEIRSLAKFCNFRPTLEEVLQDRIVCGISNDIIQRHLLTEPVLTFKKVLEISLGIEAANRNMCELHRLSACNSKQRDIASINNEINKVTPNLTGKSETCYCCVSTNWGGMPLQRCNMPFLWQSRPLESSMLFYKEN